MRIARLHIPGVVHHLIWRFIDRQWLFNDDARQRYLRLLGRALEATDWRCISYALMSNHIHLAAIGGAEKLGMWSRRVNAPFALWMNETRGGLGPVFADRPKDFAMSPASTASLIAYIHNNPVRANLVARAEDSTWTSARAYTGRAPIPGWLHVEEGLRRSGVKLGHELDAHAHSGRDDLVKLDLRRVGHAARRHGALQLGTPECHVPLVARPFATLRRDPRRLIEIVGELLNVAPAELCSNSRRPDVCHARAVAVHSARVVGIAGSDIAAVLAISRQAVSRIAHERAQDRIRIDAVCERVRFEDWWPS